ncbi:MAG: ABC transporter permease [Christensenellaceae bacterium]
MMKKKSINKSSSSKQNLVLLGLLVVILLFFTLQNPKFFSLYNIMNIMRQNVPNFIIACAMMFVIASGAIDLSIGGVMALSAVTYGYLCIWGINPWVSILIVMVLGIIVGVVNAIITEKFHIPAIMATLATWLITAGLALTICNAIPISDEPVKAITVLNKMKFFDDKIPLALFIILGVIIIFFFLEKKTILGKYAIAIGGNENAARYSGINVAKMHTIYFVLCSVMAALAGVWQVARLGSADPKIGIGMEFTVISACILGGVNIKGGAGSIVGVVIGTAILAVLTNGMQMMDIQSFYQQVVTGIVLLGAVLLDYFFTYLRKSKTRPKAIETQEQIN